MLGLGEGWKSVNDGSHRRHNACMTMMDCDGQTRPGARGILFQLAAACRVLCDTTPDGRADEVALPPKDTMSSVRGKPPVRMSMFRHLQTH